MQSRCWLLNCATGEEAIFSSLTEAELSCFLNLRHYMQRVPLAIPATASLSRAYVLFRTMGLHHLMVTAGGVWPQMARTAMLACCGSGALLCG